MPWLLLRHRPFATPTIWFPKKSGPPRSPAQIMLFCAFPGDISMTNADRIRGMIRVGASLRWRLRLVVIILEQRPDPGESDGDCAAVDHDLGRVDVARLVACEEQDGLCDFVWP